MIRDISIQNFRCFENTSISGFKTVNLITGKNNAGKTALLEALLIGNSPRPQTITNLRFYRRESPEFSRALPDKTWDSLFFNQDKSNNIYIKVSEGDNKFVDLSLSIHDNPNQILIPDALSNNIDSKHIDFIPNSNAKPALLQMNININDEIKILSTIVATNQGILEQDTTKVPETRKPSFIPANSFAISNIELAIEYDKARLDNQESHILRGLQTIDPLIKNIESFNIGSPMLYVQRADQARLPLSLFGDAIARITAILVFIISNKSNVVFIDEIENGIHYTNQANLWRMLFRLAKELNVQIFATTHSLEMLTAFTEVGLEEEFSDLAAHFEIAQSVKTGQIIGIKRDMETLEYSLSRYGGVRGE